jgi:hypothetical protein
MLYEHIRSGTTKLHQFYTKGDPLLYRDAAIVSSTPGRLSLKASEHTCMRILDP